jgi:glyoxylase-like metal-dependent hydrolase (beta-lactamase superfamily II)
MPGARAPHEGMTTRIDEITDGIFRISTPVPPNPEIPPGFTFNQFLILDDEPLLFHTGMRKLFPAVREAVARVMPVDKLRWVSFSHHECDEDGALAEWLAAAPNASVVCGAMVAMYSVGDAIDRPARILADGESLAIGKKRVTWIDTPHVPHGWDAGLLFEATTRTLFCSDLLAQPGDTHEPVVETDVVGPSEMMRAQSRASAARGDARRGVSRQWRRSTARPGDCASAVATARSRRTSRASGGRGALCARTSSHRRRAHRS